MALSDVIKKKQETGESSAKAKEKTSILDDVRIVIAIMVVASIALVALIVYTTGLINEKIVEIDKAKQTYANNQTKIEGLLSLQAQSEQFKDQKEKYDAMISTDGLDQRQIMIDLEKEVDGFLAAYYGDGWQNIKDFISLTVEKGGRKDGHMSIYENAQDCLKFKFKDIKAADKMWQNALSMAKEEYQIENVKRSMLSYRYYKGCALKGEFSVFNPMRFEENEKLYNDMIDSGVTCDGEMIFNGEMLDDPFARYVVPNKWGRVSQDGAYGIVIKTYIKILDVIEKLICLRPFLWA